MKIFGKKSKTYDIEEFISDIRKLRDEGQSAIWAWHPENLDILREETQDAADREDYDWDNGLWTVEREEFKAWKGRLKQAVNFIQQRYYVVEVEIHTRDYKTYHGKKQLDSRVAAEEAFLSDMKDTVRELTSIIDHYERHKSYPRKVPESERKLVPDPVTIKWVFDIMPRSLFWSIVVIGVSGVMSIATLGWQVFKAGMWVGQNPALSKAAKDLPKVFETKSMPTEPALAPAKPASSPSN